MKPEKKSRRHYVKPPVTLNDCRRITEGTINRIKESFHLGQILKMVVPDWKDHGDKVEQVTVSGIYKHHVVIQRKAGYMESYRYIDAVPLILKWG